MYRQGSATTSAGRLPHHIRRSLASVHAPPASHQRATRLEWPARERLDETTVGLLDDLSLGTKRLGRRSLSYEDEDDGGGGSSTQVASAKRQAGDPPPKSADGSSPTDSSGRLSSLAPRPSYLSQHGEQYEDAQEEQREERRSPAAIFGSKRIGSVVLPQQLVEGVQSRIDGGPEQVF